MMPHALKEFLNLQNKQASEYQNFICCNNGSKEIFLAFIRKVKVGIQECLKYFVCQKEGNMSMRKVQEMLR